MASETKTTTGSGFKDPAVWAELAGMAAGALEQEKGKKRKQEMIDRARLINRYSTLNNKWVQEPEPPVDSSAIPLKTGLWAYQMMKNNPTEKETEQVDTTPVKKDITETPLKKAEAPKPKPKPKPRPLYKKPKKRVYTNLLKKVAKPKPKKLCVSNTGQVNYCPDYSGFEMIERPQTMINRQYGLEYRGM